MDARPFIEKGIQPMTNPNIRRAKRFAKALKAYGIADAMDGALADLLADARHWCDRHGHSYWQIDHDAHELYLEELAEARGGRQ
jgi:hypothetical protein